MEEIKKRIIQIEERNKKVELEKAWETSRTRWISILIITYILATIVMWIIDVPEPYVNSIIPTLGYFLSVQSLPFIKKIWIRKRRQV
jgi:hypothetical protein